MVSVTELLDREILTVEYAELYRRWHEQRGIHDFERTSHAVMKYVELLEARGDGL